MLSCTIRAAETPALLPADAKDKSFMNAEGYYLFSFFVFISSADLIADRINRNGRTRRYKRETMHAHTQTHTRRSSLSAIPKLVSKIATWHGDCFVLKQS